jgi:hypothetical protein
MLLERGGEGMASVLPSLWHTHDIEAARRRERERERESFVLWRRCEVETSLFFPHPCKLMPFEYYPVSSLDFVKLIGAKLPRCQSKPKTVSRLRLLWETEKASTFLKQVRDMNLAHLDRDLEEN